MSQEQVYRPTGPPATGRVTPAAFPFYTTGEDNIRVTSWNTAAGVSLKVNGRLIDNTGRANADTWDHTPNTDRSAKTSEFSLSGSTLLNLTVFASAGAPQMGQTFVKVELIRGLGVGAIVLGTVLQGYITASQAIGWPGSPLQTSLDSGGYYRTIIGTRPAAGAAIVETVPVGARWSLISLLAQITTVASGSVRPVYLRFADSVPTGEAPTVAVAGNGTNTIFSWVAGLPLAVDLGPAVNRMQGLPTPLVLSAGNTFSVIVDNIQPADQWDAPAYRVQEWLEV